VVERFLAKEEVEGSSPFPRSFHSVNTRFMKKLEIVSPAFKNKRTIPQIYTCDGAGINPPLEFHNIPNETESLVLIVDDPDAPGKFWRHWIIFNIPATVTSIPQNCLNVPGIEAYSDFGMQGYGAPCPPNGPHRYNFKLYALDRMLSATEDVSRLELDALMSSCTIEKAELMGIYSRD